MKFANRVWSVVAVALALVVTAQLTRIAGELAAEPLEPSSRKVFALSNSTREFLAGLEDELFLTYYASDPATLPSNMRSLQRDVERVLAALQRDSASKVHFEIVEPDSQPELSPYFTELGLSKFRARNLEHDGWSEVELWSSLRIARAGLADTTLHAITPEMLPGLQHLIVEQARALVASETRRPRIALAAPGGHFARLEALLARDAEVTRIDLDSDPQSLPADTDLLFWLDSEQSSAAHIRALAEHVESGRPAILTAGQSQRGSSEALLAEYGVRLRSGQLLSADSSPQLLCTAHNQDFRPFGSQPNGNLRFDGASRLELDGERLSVANRTTHTLASSKIDTRLTGSEDTAGAQPLLLQLASGDPFAGDVIVAASSTPFRDSSLADDESAHRGLVRVLLDELVSPSKLVWNRAAITRAARLGAPTDSERTLWRGVVIFLVPGLCACVALFIFAKRTRRTTRGALGKPILVGLTLAIPALATLLASQLAWRADQTEQRVHSVSAEELEVLTRALEGGSQGELELFLSPPAELPPELRVSARRARRWCEQLSSRITNLRFTTPEVDETDPRLEPQLVSSQGDEATRVRRVVAALRIRLGSESTVLNLAQPADYKNVRFRIAFAFWRLAEQRDITVAVAAPAGRLSAAEDQLDYREEGLYAPNEGDPFGLARALLARNDFELVAIDPTAELPKLDPDLFVWLQPRRPIGSMLRFAAHELAGGGNVLLAAQHYEIVARQLRRDEMQLSLWPRPQHADLERDYLLDLGINLKKELFFDERSAPTMLSARIERRLGDENSGHELEQQFSAQPFSVRVLPEPAQQGSLLRGIEALLLNSPSEIQYERVEPFKFAFTPLLRSSTQHWTHAWQGGSLSGEVLSPPADSGETTALLGALVEGRFPEVTTLRERHPDGTATTTYRAGQPHSGPRGTLLLTGSSTMFEDAALASPDFDNEQFLLQSVIQLTLGDELTTIASKRLTSPSLARPDAGDRKFWRAFVLGTGPMLALLLAVLSFALRAAGKRARIPAQ